VVELLSRSEAHRNRGRAAAHKKRLRQCVIFDAHGELQNVAANRMLTSLWRRAGNSPAWADFENGQERVAKHQQEL